MLLSLEVCNRLGAPVEICTVYLLTKVDHAEDIPVILVLIQNTLKFPLKQTQHMQLLLMALLKSGQMR